MDRKSFILLVLFTAGMFLFNSWFFETNKSKIPSSTTKTLSAEPTSQPVENRKENFYVLENETMQVVFSDIGGAVTEINLPFKTNQNPQSIVLPIEYDKQILTDSPLNSRFPLKDYTTFGSSSLQKPKSGGYYPLLRRGIEGKRPYDISPTYYAFNIVADDAKELAATAYKVKNLSKDSITFEGTALGRTITKTFKFISSDEGLVPYTLHLDIEVSGNTTGLSLTSGVPEVEMISGNPTSEIKYRMTKKEKTIVSKGKLTKTSAVTEAPMIDWVSNSNGFFGILLQKSDAPFTSYETNYVQGTKDPTRLTLIDPKNNRYPASKLPGYFLQVPLTTQSKKSSFTLYAGPYEKAILDKVDRLLASKNKDISYDFAGALTNHGWFAFISEPFAKFLFVIMQFTYAWSHSWVVAIFFLTLILRVILYPLNSWSLKSMAKIQEINPQLTALKTKYANDPKKMNLEMIELYRQKGVSPFSSFIPLFIQMPFFIGMLDLLKSSFQLRGSPFIPGWINNLTSPDVLFSWGYPLPFLGDSFHLLPLILGGLTFLQQKISMKLPTSAQVTKEAEKEARMRNAILTAFITLIFYNMPSGLSLYWIFSTVLGLLQQIVMANKLPFLPKFKTR